MPTWKKIIVSGSQAELLNVTSSGYRVTGSAFQQFLGAPNTTGGTIITGSFSGSFSGAITGTITNATSASFLQIGDLSSVSATQYVTFVGATTGYQSQSVDTNLTYQPSTDTLTLGNIAVNSGSITTTSSSFNIATTNATAIQIGGSSATVTIPGNFTVNGTTTVINTTNLEVKDAFVLLASGSAVSTTDGGIIVQGATQGSGSALFWEGTDSRWALQQNVASSAGNTTAVNSYLVSVSGSSGSPSGNPTYGGATNGIGNLFIDTSLTAATDNNIWIFA